MRNKKLVIMILIVIVLSAIGSAFVIFAGSGSYGPMTFDESGRLSFETVDNAAINIAYKTIGWTIKRYDLPIDDPNNMTITCTLQDDSRLESDGKVHTVFYVERSQIMEKASQISPEWAEEIKMVGGVAYLDNIMTVREYGDYMGELHDDGSCDGEVYFTYDGIAGARGWKNPEDLHQYFDRMVIIEPEKPIHEGDQDINDESYMVAYYNIGESGLNIDSAGEIYSNDYEVTEAVPSGEPVIAQGEFSKYAYKLEYKKVTGEKTYEVCVHVSATLSWTDAAGIIQEEEVDYEQVYYVTRQYVCYELKKLTLYHLHVWNIRNAAFGSVSISNSDYPQVTKNYNFHVTDPIFEHDVYIDEGVIEGSNYRPSVTFGDYAVLAESQVGMIDAQSDSVYIDNNIILGEFGEQSPATDSQVVLRNGISTTSDISNGFKDTDSTCIYMVQEGDMGVQMKDVSVNELNIHTPVVSYSLMLDNRADNQMISPVQNRYSMILGKSFWVNTGSYGEHIDAKGYGTRDYSQFAADSQVRFPFDTIRDGTIFEAGTWISVGKNNDNNRFVLPVYISEGAYTVEMRSLAINYHADNRSASQNYANTDQNNYVADSTCDVYVSGQIKDFKITDVTDKKCKKELPVTLLPIRQPALRQGYGYDFELTTVGDVIKDDYILIEPTFRLIPYDGSDSFDIDLYILQENDAEWNFIKVANSLASEFMVHIDSDDTGHIRKWKAYYSIPARLYPVPKGFDINSYYETHILHDNSGIWEKSGYIDVNFNISTVVGNVKRLNYANLTNEAGGYCNMWRDEGYKLQDKFVYGDIALYYGDRNFMEDYQIVGTH